MTTHHKKHTATYAVWSAMKARCDNPAGKDYVNYGGRGITYSTDWATFEGFLADMGMRPERVEELTLERLNNDGNYCKDNCAWATRSAQNHNSRLRKDNQTGLKGVRYDLKRAKWEVACSINGIRTFLYWGKDYFEACCIRKSWELRRTGVRGA